MKFNLLFVLCIIIIPEPISKWKSYAVPTKEQANKWNMGSSDWRIYSEGKEIFATDDRYFISEKLPFELNKECSLGGRQTILKVNDGYLVGFDRGEWGGGLFWYDAKGSNCYKISSEQVVKSAIV